MTTTDKMEKARDALSTAIERYDAMGWFDDGDDDERAEAESMEKAFDEGDEIAMAVALDTALSRFDCMGFDDEEAEVKEITEALEGLRSQGARR